MTSRYPSQTFELYEHPQWQVEPKPGSYAESDDSSVLDEKVLDPTTPTELSNGYRQPSYIKSEEEYAAGESVWERPHGMMGAMRHYSQPTVPTFNNQQAFMQSYAAYPPAWSMSNSGTSTPTPVYGDQISFTHGSGTALPYQGGPVTFQQPQDPNSAISMSPQSSQGGWASGTSSDTTEPRASRMRSPSSYRAVSPSSAIRPDGIRKKNARFEIPKDRNLGNIDQMIQSTKDEAMKKELKQQKRLLRNRQAALDSRQRKKTHTEKLEHEKKLYTQQKQDMEEEVNAAHSALQAERERFMQQRQGYEHYIHQLEFERDEAIRAKTLETAELRKMNNILKDHIKDIERQTPMRQYTNVGASNDNFAPDFNSFDNLDIEDSWGDDEFSIITNDPHGDDDSLKMDSLESLQQQQSTPKPLTSSLSTSLIKASDTKNEVSFWNTFYMCLLFGAFIATNSSSTSTHTAGGNSSGTSSTAAAMPALPPSYRAEAGNVLKAVLASNPSALHPASITSTSVSSSLHPQTQQQQQQPPLTASPLDLLTTHLTTPSPAQRLSSAFSLSASSYAHIANPDSDMDDSDLDADVDPTPTPLASAFASMQAQREASGLDRVFRGASDRSLLWERVPEQVLQDFREMVAGCQGQDVGAN